MISIVRWLGRVLPVLCGVGIFSLVAGCSSNEAVPIPGLQERFDTQVAADGTKRFTYRLEMARPDVPRPVTSADRQRSRMPQSPRDVQRQRSRANNNLARLFDRSLQEKLAQTGFCREGYFELERTLHAGGGEVRGECREAAQ